MKNWLRYFIGIVAIVSLGGLLFPVLTSWNNDIRLTVIAGDGLGLVSISPERRMVNLVVINSDTEIWIPGGLGWYQVRSIEKLLKQENKVELWPRIVFYNFGFWSNEVIKVDSIGEWSNGLDRLIWLKWKILAGRMLPRTQELTGKRIDEEEMGEIAIRDLADNEIVDEDIRLSVINQSDESGLANFVAQRFDWAGAVVTDVSTGEDVADNCRIIIKDSIKGSRTLAVVSDNLIGCNVESDESISDGTMEIYLGKNWAQMLDYSNRNYVRSF